MGQGFDVEGARKAGYSDDDILQHLTSTRKFDVQGAMKAGYSKADIINHLATAPAPQSTPMVDQSQPTQFEKERLSPVALAPTQRAVAKAAGKPAPTYAGLEPTVEGNFVPKGTTAAAMPVAMANNLTGTELGTSAQGVGDVSQGNLARGAHRIISGGLGTLAPLLPSALAAAPVKTAAALGLGAAGQYAGSEGAQLLGASPDQAALTGDLTGLLSGYLGYKTASIPEKIPTIPSVEELTKTTPERIAEIKSFPQKVESVRQSIVAADKAAHQVASDAFPKFEQPIPTGRMIEKPAAGPAEMTDFGEVSPTAQVPEMTTFKALQEQRSNLLKNIASERQLVDAGQKPAFDLERMIEQRKQVDALMEKAALEQGGEQGLQQLQEARQKFSQYMDDFHNPGAPVRPLLKAKPGETAKVVMNLLRPDTGARALEVLRKYGADTSNIEGMLTQGDRPIRIDVNESAKLRRAGSEDAYTTQRLRESLRQATVNELPSAAQERLPASAMSNKPMYGTKKIPVVRDYLTPKAITRRRLENALKQRGGS